MVGAAAHGSLFIHLLMTIHGRLIIYCRPHARVYQFRADFSFVVRWWYVEVAGETKSGLTGLSLGLTHLFDPLCCRQVDGYVELFDGVQLAVVLHSHL